MNGVKAMRAWRYGDTRKLMMAMLLLIAVWQLSQGVYIHAKALLAQLLLEQAWSQTRMGDMRSAPWPWADTWPVARLQVPRLDVDLIVLAGDSGRTLAFGPGHNFASAIPGEPGTALISAHRDTHFRFLKDVQAQDEIQLHTPEGRIKSYRVQTRQIMHADQAELLMDERVSRLTLVTCYPFDALRPGGSLRYVVSAVEM